MTIRQSKADIGKKYKVAKDYTVDGMKVDTHSSFGDNIKTLFARIKPRKIIETGTYLGTGTTTIIAEVLKGLGIIDAVFYTIEVNPEYYAKAKKYFNKNNIKVYALNGLSVPRSVLPSREEISRKTITNVEYDDIFVDHEARNRAQLYYDETNFPNVEDDLLGRCLKAFQYKPDFVLLDSAGHMGNIEFNYLVEYLRGSCYIALDDIYHIKHHKSFRQIQSDPRFEVVTASKEKFGFCIAKFTPSHSAKGPAIPVATLAGKDKIRGLDKRKLAGLSAAEFEEFLRNKVGTAENHKDVADALELLTPDQYLPDDIRMFRETANKDTNVWTPISTLNAISKNFKIQNYLEIGVRRGRSLCQILFHNTDADVYAFDLWIANYAGAENPGPEFVQSEMMKFGYKKKINFYNGDSSELLPKFFLNPIATKYCDVIYVDGDHSYEGALKDLRNVAGHLRPGGILIFDDVNHPQHKYLAEVWDTIKAENPNLAYFGSDYGYGLRIALNNQAHCSDGRYYVSTNDCGNLVEAGAGALGTTKAVGGHPSAEIVCDVSSSRLSSKPSCRVLVIRPDSIGDFIIFSGILHYFRKLYSDADISLLVQKHIAELAHSCPYIDDVIPFDRRLAETDGSCLDSLVEHLRAAKFDVVINPVYSRTILDDYIALKIGAKLKIAFVGDDTNMDMGRKLLNDTYYDMLVPATDGLLIETKRNEEFIRGLGVSVDKPCEPTIWLKPQDQDYIDGLLDELGIREPVVVCPFAQAEYRQWPIHKWAELLSRYEKLPVLICGTGKDRTEADLLIDLTGHKNIHNICGKTTLRQLAALFSKSKLCVASESGTAHIAAAMDCPQVVIIGGGHFGRFMPYSPQTNLVYLPNDCYNCNWKCPHWRWEIYCISQVSVEIVDKAVREVLRKPCPPDGQPRFFKDILKFNSDSTLVVPVQRISDNVQNDTDERKLHCWCGGNLSESVHPLYGLCKDCATLVLKDKPTKKQLRKLYSIDGYWHKQMSSNDYPQIEQRAVSDFKDRIPAWYDVLVKYKSRPENVLEIGCAHGGFLNYCRQRGVNNVVGVEVDKEVCKFAREYFKLPNIVCGLFPDVSLPFDKFDVIVGFDVLEHLMDPIGALKKVSDMLTDDGICFFQVPCYRGEGAEWVQFRPGEHIYLFNNESIKRVFEAGGLEVDEVSPGYFTDDIFIVARRKRSAAGVVSAGDRDIKKNAADILVTAIVSTYNSEDCIASCLQDLEEQTIADKLEIIVVDSGSSQNERTIVNTFRQKYKNIKYIRTENRETIYKAWNRAIRMASGRYITNANTDDTHRSDALEILAGALEKNPGAMLAYANQGCVDKAGGESVKEFISGEFSRYRMLAEWCYISSHPMWRKDVHKEFGYFDETFVAAGDWEFWLRISQKYDAVHINQNLGNRLWTEDCLSRNEFEREDGLAITEAELIRKCYHYALENTMVIDYRAISANPVFASWPEVDLWKQKVQAKLGGVEFDPNVNIKSVNDYRGESTPRLSIVIVSYNNLSELQENLHSLNEQTENNFEVIVVNSGQVVPKPEQIVGRLKYGFCCVELKQNLGFSFARNIGIKQARGEYVAFLEDGTIAERDFAKRILEHFGNYEIYGLRGRVLPKDGARFKHIPAEFDLGENVIFSACEIGTNFAFRRDILDRVGGFNENLFGYEMQELSYKVFKADDEKIDTILYFPDVVVYHKPSTENLTYYFDRLRLRIGKKTAEYKWPQIGNYIELARNLYPNRREQLEKDYIRLLNIASFLQKRYPREAVKWAEKAVAINPGGIICCYTLGSLYLRLGRNNEATAVFEKTLELVGGKLSGEFVKQAGISNCAGLVNYMKFYGWSCIKLADCYIRTKEFGKLKTIYEHLLRQKRLELSSEYRAKAEAILAKLDKVAAIPVGGMSGNMDWAAGEPKEHLVVSNEASKDTMKVPASQNRCLVSAIVSTYNAQRFLRACLEDLENQTIADKLEIIVVNSGSQQNEESIVREFQKKYNNIVYIKTDEREGLYTAWNRAIKVASGLLLTSANTDDRHHKDALEIMASVLLTSPDIALTYGDQIITDTPNPTFENHHVIETARRPEFSRERLLFGCCVGSQPMWRKSLHDEFGYFDESLICAADWDFWLKIAGKYKFKHIPEILGLYYRNEDGIEHGRKIHSLYERYKVGRRYGNPYISVIPLYKAGDNPLVSIIMPTYNAADYIKRAIESVLIQNYRNFELIVVDDGSADRTADIVNSFRNEPIKYFFKENGGVASARNFGVQKAGGSFIIMLDSDDMMTPDYIARHLSEFERHPEMDMVYCDDLLIDEQDKPIRVIKRPEYSDPNTFVSDMFRCGFPLVHFKTCIRKSVFDQIGLYDERLIVAEDFDMIRRFVKKGLKMHHLPAALYLRRLITAGSLSRNFSAEKAKSHFDVIHRFTETFAPEQLFPDVRWDKLPAEQKSMLTKCKTALVCLGIGERYLGSNAPDYAEEAFEMASTQLDECCKIEPANQQVRNLREKCRSIRARRLPPGRQLEPLNPSSVV